VRARLVEAKLHKGRDAYSSSSRTQTRSHELANNFCRLLLIPPARPACQKFKLAGTALYFMAGVNRI